MSLHHSCPASSDSARARVRIQSRPSPGPVVVAVGVVGVSLLRTAEGKSQARLVTSKVADAVLLQLLLLLQLLASPPWCWLRMCVMQVALLRFLIFFTYS